MNINFENKESRVAYLSERFTDLLDGVNESYGQALIDELMNRLSQTISDYDEEVETLMTELKGNSKKRVELLHSIMSSENLPEKEISNSNGGSLEPTSEGTGELSDWEKRLEALDNK
jgi:hypothetical protein